MVTNTNYLVTGQWERLAAIDIAGGGHSHMKVHKESFSSAAGGATSKQMGKFVDTAH